METGYKKKPLAIVIFSVFYLLCPFLNLVWILIVSKNQTAGQTIDLLIGKLYHGDPVMLFYVVLILMFFPLAYGLYKVRLWAWYYFLIFTAALFIINIFKIDAEIIKATSTMAFKQNMPLNWEIMRIKYNIDLSVNLLINLIILIPVGFFIKKEIKAPYFNPRLRWWEQHTRVNHHNFKVKFNEKEFRTFDVSESGMFINVDDPAPQYLPGSIAPVEISIDEKTLQFKGEVRWSNPEPKGRYPKGYGIKFIITDKESIRIIRSFIDGVAHYR